MTQYGFFYDESRCIDCRACSVACQSWNSIEKGTEKYLRRFTWEEGVFPEVKMHYLFAPCYHCEKPACAESCPQKAIFKEPKYGAVLVDEALCDGCKDCWDACPYGSPRFTDEPKMKKCTLCIDRLENDQVPACVATCIPRALDFGPLTEIEKKYGTCRSFASLPDPSSTKPSIIFKEAPAKTKLVSYDADKARKLFGDRGDKLDPLYTDLSVFNGASDGTVKKTSLNMKIADPNEELVVLRSDER